MPRISLNDALGLDVNGKLAPGARIGTIIPAFARFQNTPLDQVPFQEAQSNLVLDQPVGVAAGSLGLNAGGRGGVSLRLIGHSQRAIDENDPFSTIPVEAGELYVSLGLDFSVGSPVSIPTGSATFGFSKEKAIKINCYRRFRAVNQAFPTFAQAIALTASSFVLPRTPDDIEHLDNDTVVVLSGVGTLVVSGEFTTGTPVSALASTSQLAGRAIDVNASGEFDVTAALTLAGGYQIRLRQLESRQTEIGVYTFNSREAALIVTAQIGVSAAVGKFDLAERLIKALSRQPIVDVDEFRKALPGEDSAGREQQIEAFESTLKDAVSQKIQASVSGALSLLKSTEQAWTFQIDWNTAASPLSAAAIQAALQGDFTPLTAASSTPPLGIKQLSNVLTRTDARKLTLQVNLLGIVNFLSVSKIARMSTVQRDAQGNITLLTDTSSDTALKALFLNAAVNTRRLRQLLSENFLIAAAYQASNVGVLPPEFKSDHTYFEVDERTSRDEMKDNLDVARVLGTMPPEEEARRLNQKSNFGPTTFYTRTEYTGDVIRRIFLNQTGAPRAVEEYEQIGRSALAALLEDDTGQEFRKLVVDPGSQGTALWAKLKGIGNVSQFGPLFGISLSQSDPRVAAVGSDYIAITSWAAAMHEMGKVLNEVDALLKGRVQTDAARLSEAREHLKKRMTDVVKHSQEHFGDPFGLIMIYLAANRDAGKRVILQGSEIEPFEFNSSSTTPN